MRAGDVPLGRRRTPETRCPEPAGRRGIFDRERDRPQGEARLPVGEYAGDPEQGGQHEPRRDALEIAVIAAVVPAQRPQHERRAADLHQHIGRSETGGPGPEGFRDRRRQNEPDQHQRKQRDAHRRGPRVEPVGGPGGVDPHPPHRHQHQRGLHDAGDGEMLEQIMRQLRDREHEHEVEKQFDERDLRVLVRLATAQEAGACAENHASAGLKRPDTTIRHNRRGAIKNLSVF